MPIVLHRGQWRRVGETEAEARDLFTALPSAAAYDWSAPPLAEVEVRIGGYWDTAPTTVYWSEWRRFTAAEILPDPGSAGSFSTRFCDLGVGTKLLRPDWVEWVDNGGTSTWSGAMRETERVVHRKAGGGGGSVDPLSRASLSFTARDQIAYVVGYASAVAGNTFGAVVCGQDAKDLHNRNSSSIGYMAVLNGGTTLALRYHDDTPGPGHQTLASMPFAHAVGERIHVKAEYVFATSTVRAKAWKEGAPEPGWMLSVEHWLARYGAPGFVAFGTTAVDVAAFAAAVNGAALPELPCCDAALRVKAFAATNNVVAYITPPSYFGTPPLYFVYTGPTSPGPWALASSGMAIEHNLGPRPLGSWVRVVTKHSGGCLSLGVTKQVLPDAVVIPHAQWEITDWRTVRIPWP